MENKKTKIVSIIAIIALVLTLVTATYAYFQAQTGEGSQADVKINANTVDTLTFETGSAISLSLDQTSFAQGTGNQIGTTFAKTMLTANNKTNSAIEHYYLYLNIENNTFTYSIDENTPEIIMTITDSAGTEVTDISTLAHVIVTGANGTQVSGYDVTNKSGLITLFNNREITTTSSKEEKWNITITFVNYDASQNANVGKNMSAKVMIQKDKLPEVLSEVCTNGNNLATCITTLSSESVSEATNIYYHDDTLINGAADNSYRYSGANPSNFVCFGTNETPCPIDNLYRIIGVFNDQVKLIKYDYANSNLLGTGGAYRDAFRINKNYYKGSFDIVDRYAWNNTTRTNTWSESSLNTSNLNGIFIKYIGTEWAKKIATTTWKVKGSTYSNVFNSVPLMIYQNEIVGVADKETYKAQIGLMYISDYVYGASPNVWTSTLSNYNSIYITSVNWIYMGFYEWTIYRLEGNSVIDLMLDGSVYHESVNSSCGVRPTFYLVNSVNYLEGDGTQNSPIRIS